MKKTIQLFILTIGLVTSTQVLSIPMPDVYESVRPGEGNLNEGMGAYQDHENSYQWHYLPLSFQIAKKYNATLGKQVLSFKHSFFQLFEEEEQKDLSHSYYQFVFEPIYCSSKTQDMLQEKIAKAVTKQFEKKAFELEKLNKISEAAEYKKIVMKEEINLTPMLLTNMYFDKLKQMGELSLDKFVTYIDMFGDSSTQNDYMSVLELYRGFPVDLIVHKNHEPKFSEHLVKPAEAGLPIKGKFVVEFSGLYNFIEASATVDYQKFFEFIETKWVEEKKTGHWFWKKKEYIERTKIELAKEAHNAGITMNVKINGRLGEKQTISEVGSDGSIVEKSIDQYVREQLAHDISEQMFVIEKIKNGDDEMYRVSEDPGIKTQSGSITVEFKTTRERNVLSRGLFIFVDGLTSDLIDPNVRGK